MDLSVLSERIGGDDLRWLGSKHASNDASTVTLDVAKFTAFAGDTIPSGVPLKEGADGKYEPVSDAGDELAGFLLTSQPNRGTYQVAPMLWQGRIRARFLPDGAFDVSGLEDKGQFVILGKEVK